MSIWKLLLLAQFSESISSLFKLTAVIGVVVVLLYYLPDALALVLALMFAAAKKFW